MKNKRELIVQMQNNRKVSKIKLSEFRDKKDRWVKNILCKE
ncbi:MULTISPECIES: hypothetical protein [Paraliobacillus]|nr:MULTISPECIES: hypothetical protein [Paraliobacillus]